jgi:hypothetical protein
MNKGEMLLAATIFIVVLGAAFFTAPRLGSRFYRPVRR